jgi:hypothetical protein
MNETKPEKANNLRCIYGAPKTEAETWDIRTTSINRILRRWYHYTWIKIIANIRCGLDGDPPDAINRHRARLGPTPYPPSTIWARSPLKHEIAHVYGTIKHSTAGAAWHEIPTQYSCQWRVMTWGREWVRWTIVPKCLLVRASCFVPKEWMRPAILYQSLRRNS